MDLLSWDGSVMMNPSSIWRNYSNHEDESFLTSNSDSCFYPYPIQPFQRADNSSMSNLNTRRVNEVDQTSCHPSDGEARSREEKIEAGSCPTRSSRPCAMNRKASTFSGSLSNAGNVFFHQVGNDEPNGKTLPIGSYIESLDCLLSSPASCNTDKSVEEDDEISLVLSDCRNLLNFGEAGNTVSSRESEKKIFKERKMDEAVSQSRYGNNEIIKPKRRSNQREPRREKNSGGFSFLHSESCDGFKFICEHNLAKQKKPKSGKSSSSSSNINFQQPSSMGGTDSEGIEQMKEIIYRAAAFRPVNLGVEVVEKPKRKNVRISTDPQTVAARQRRDRISERIRVLQKLVPGGSKMDTASMLDEAANYLKFLRTQIKSLEGLSHPVDSISCPPTNFAFSFSPSFPMQTYFSLPSPHQIHNSET